MALIAVACTLDGDRESAWGLNLGEYVNTQIYCSPLITIAGVSCCPAGFASGCVHFGGDRESAWRLNFK